MSHPFISDKERDFLKRELGEIERISLPPTPFKAILTSRVFIALLFAQVHLCLIVCF